MKFVLKGSARWSTMSSKAVVLVLLLVMGQSLYGSDFDTLKITASLDTLNKQVHGYVEYPVPENPRLSRLEFQLFPNAYSGKDTPYLINYPELRNRLRISEKWGGMEIDSLFIGNEDFSDKVQVEYTRGALPVGSNKAGKTVRIYFTTTVPEMGDRLSYNKDEYLLDGWFPNPAILREDGSWYNPRYGMMAELVGNYYHYEVSFTAPSKYVIAASTLEETIDTLEDGLSVHYYEIGPVHDFALALSPRYEVKEVEKDGIRIRTYLRDFEFPMHDKIIASAGLAFDYMGERCGKYPYKSISFACADIGFTGGIEFPGMIVLSSPRGAALLSKIYNQIIIHETVHEWFYGLVGSDQIETPWLDEAVTEFFTSRISDKNYDDILDFWGFVVDEDDQHRMVIKNIENEYQLSNPTYGFAVERDYFGVIYSRGDLIIQTIDNLIGEDNSRSFWKDYFSTYRYRRPGTDDFIKTLAKYSDKQLIALTDYLLNSPGLIDWSVAALNNESVGEDSVDVSFILTKKGDFEFPVDYRLYLVNGDSIRGTWDPEYSRKKIRLQTEVPVEKIVVDPDNRFAVDVNLLNNSDLYNEDNRAGMRLGSGVLFLIESLLSYLGGI